MFATRRGRIRDFLFFFVFPLLSLIINIDQLGLWILFWPIRILDFISGQSKFRFLILSNDNLGFWFWPIRVQDIWFRRIKIENYYFDQSESSIIYLRVFLIKSLTFCSHWEYLKIRFWIVSSLFLTSSLSWIFSSQIELISIFILSSSPLFVPFALFTAIRSFRIVTWIH